MFDLSGKTAIVTGATGGLGQAIARALHAQGAHVVVTGTRQNVLDELASELSTNVTAKACNLGDKDAIEDLVESALSVSGQIDILVNNAGITRDGLLMRMKDEDWDTVLAVNLTAAFRLTRATVKHMMKKRSGRIISISSVVGATGNPGQTNYVATKAGLVGFSKALAQEVASRGITVNCIAPGFIETAMTDALNDAQKSAILAKIPTGTMGTPDDIASGVIYLASDEAGYMTGQTLHINGGMAML